MERTRQRHDPDPPITELPPQGRVADESPVGTRGRSATVLEAVRRKGLLDGETSRIGGRIRRRLIEAARRQSGIASDTQLIEYALARVALEDSFVATLYALEGTIDPSVDLEL